MFRELWRGSWINHRNVCSLLAESWRLRDKVLHLPRAERTLITRPAAQHDEHNRRLGGELLKLDLLVIERPQNEIRSDAANCRPHRRLCSARRKRKNRTRGQGRRQCKERTSAPTGKRKK